MDFNPSIQSEIILRKCLLVEQPAQPTQHYRPYETAYSHDIERQLVESSKHGAAFSPAAVRDTAVGLIQPSSVAHGILHIPNGWQTKRVAVFIDVEVRTRMGTYREIITGFSDYVGVSAQGNIDPKMVIFPNNYIKYKSTLVQNASGSYTHAWVDANDQILRPINSDNSTFGLRPKDSLIYLSYGDLGEVYDPRVKVDNKGLLSDRKNLVPSQYLSRTLMGFNSALQDTEGFGGIDGQYAQAAENTAEHTYVNTSLFTLLDRECGYLQTGYFPMHVLLGLYPDRNDGTYHYVPMPSGSIVDYSTNTENWGVTSKEAKIAFALSNLVPSVISSYMVVGFNFHVTNNVPTSQVYLSPQAVPIPMFDGIDNPKMLAAMESQLVAEISSIMRTNYVGSFHVTVSCNLFGNCLINVSIDGGPYVPFTAPNYCDSITSPLQAANLNQGKAFAGDICSALNAAFSDTVKTDLHRY